MPCQTFLCLILLSNVTMTFSICFVRFFLNLKKLLAGIVTLLTKNVRLSNKSNKHFLE